MTSWRVWLMMAALTSQLVVDILCMDGTPAIALSKEDPADTTTSGNNDVAIRRLAQCGTERCGIYRSIFAEDLFYRCLESRCGEAVPRRSRVATPAQKVDCTTACIGTDGIAYIKCVSRSCSFAGRLAASSFCPSACRVIAPETAEECLKRYCLDSNEQEDQGGEMLKMEANREGNDEEKRWGNRLNWAKRWGNRVGRRYTLWSKRWGSRVCLQAHCGSLSNNRQAYVMCGQNFCSRRRRRRR